MTLQADKSYTASVVLDGAELSYFGQEGQQEVPVPDSKVQPNICISIILIFVFVLSIFVFILPCGQATFQFQCSSESTNGTGVQGGQIPEIIFYGPTH